MRMNIVRMATLLLAGGILAIASADDRRNPKARLSQKEVEKRWADHWVEVEVIEGGTKVDPFHYLGHSFVPDPKEGGAYANWPLTGELVLSRTPCSIVLDAKPEPMRADFHGVLQIVPGIFRFEGDDLVWVTPKENGVMRKGPFGKPLVRPTDFTSTKENGHVVRRLKRTDGLYGDKPLKK